MKTYSILVNTCDSFEDCWEPFFRLWSLYWPDCPARVYLNTEYKTYSGPEKNVVSLRSCAGRIIPGRRRATWSECLKWALEAMETDTVLYMQEDYFLTAPVDGGAVERYAAQMRAHPEIPCIQLTPEGIPAREPSRYEGLFTSDPDYPWYACCQASLWRREALLSLLRKEESAWKFECFGSRRAKYSRMEFLTVDPSLFSREGYQIIPYIFTGIIHGKWYGPVAELFERHGISMDFSRRGFFDPEEKPPCSARIRNAARNWKTWRSRLELRSMKRRFLREENACGGN